MLDEALTRALNVQASINIYSSQEKKIFQFAQLNLVPTGTLEVHELGLGQTWRCLTCNKPGHLVCDCCWLASVKQHGRGPNRGQFKGRYNDGWASNATRGWGNSRGRGHGAPRGRAKKKAPCMEQLQEEEPATNEQALYVEETETSRNE